MFSEMIDFDALSSWNVFFHKPTEKAQELYFALENAGHQIYNGPYPLVRSDYDNYLIMLTMKGKGILKYREKIYNLKEGDFFLY